MELESNHSSNIGILKNGKPNKDLKKVKKVKMQDDEPKDNNAISPKNEDSFSSIDEEIEELPENISCKAID